MLGRKGKGKGKGKRGDGGVDRGTREQPVSVAVRGRGRGRGLQRFGVRGGGWRRGRPPPAVRDGDHAPSYQSRSARRPCGVPDRQRDGEGEGDALGSQGRRGGRGGCGVGSHGLQVDEAKFFVTCTRPAAG